MSLFGSSGIRGIVGRDLTIDLASEIGSAVGTAYDRVILGKDTRTSGDMISQALVAGITSAGSDVYSAGMLPTPTLARAATAFGCGLMVTASHNPPEYNGVKMWNPDGSAFDTKQMNHVEGLISRKEFSRPDWRGVGKAFEHLGAIESHIESILKSLGTFNCRVVVDCGCGAASVVTPTLLSRLGCEVFAINSHPDGFFPGRSPEPTEDQLKDLKDAVLRRGADVGIAHDGDGDRMVAVDERGRFVSGDRLLALFASRYGAKGMVAPIDASMVLDDIVEGPVVRCRVGDVYVSEALKRSKLEYGGEPSGTFIFSKETYCPDGIYAGALLAKMAGSGPLSEIVDVLQSYPSSRESYSFDPSGRKVLEAGLAKEMEGVKCDRLLTIDGFRADYADGWFLIRVSGTEPKLRVTAEARSEGELKRLKEIYGSVVRTCLR
ncbi:MAG: phosphoglucosamine mutase [Methanomassiliicoccales archaeon]|nr:phosphoglucosamine mutase [Methanomassiliicoccales archaeon]